VRRRFDALLECLGEISDLEMASRLLMWDQETKMPPLGAEARAEQRGTLVRIAHERQTARELGALLEDLRPFEEANEHDSFEASVIRVARRDYEKAVRVPASLRAARARQGSLGYRAWLEARARNDYDLLLPHLERGLELTREYVACFEPEGDPYDVLLDDYEPGMTSEEVETVFAVLKAHLMPMLRAVAEPVDDSCLRGSFPPDAQRRFAVGLLEHWGMDGEAWRLDDTVHPFAESLSPSDIRLTSNFDEDGLQGILSCMHEFGHGIYERQIDPRYARTPLAHGASYAFHESQSRLWENLVGRSLASWRFLFPRLRASFPERLSGVSLEAFSRALNRVAPSLRRVDADEVTYSLHIIVRFELERELLSGAVTLAELPEAFDAKMEAHLGLRPANAVEGVLQDVHWSDTGFAYFPTYALGNVISVQLWECAAADLGDLEAQFERGEFAPLRQWLGEHVHRWGRVFTPEELLRRIVGGSLDPQPYLDHLRHKLEDLHGPMPT
jgi:carboxypeptidase Taq